MSGSLLTSFLLAAADDELVRRLLGLARAVAQGRLAPRCLRVAARAGLALASAVRMVPGVHRRAAHRRPDAEPAAASGLAAGLVLVLDRSDLARDAMLVALEVDLPVELAVAAALVARGDPALVVAAGMRRDRLDEGLLGRVGRDLVEAGDRHEPAARAGRLELSNRHF